MSPKDAAPGTFATWTGDVKQLRRRTRVARGTPWFPLTLFGMLVLGSTPLYATPTASCPPSQEYCMETVPPSPFSGLLFLGGFTTNPTAVAIFWLIAGPLAYLATAAFYQTRAQRRGVALSTSTYLATGLGLLTVLLVTTWVGVFPFGNFIIRGLTPLITVAIGLFALARSERSWPLAGFAAVFFALVLVANLYDMENLTYRLGLGWHGLQVNVLVLGAVLVLAGAGFGLASAVGRRQLR